MVTTKNDINKKVAVVGGGVAGMQAAATLLELGFDPVIIEKNERLGGKLNDWYHLFPTFTPAAEVLDDLKKKTAGAEVITGAEVQKIGKQGVELKSGETIESGAVIVASGFDVFRAEIKEEYGYGIYDNIFTSVDIEKMLQAGKVSKADGSEPSRIAFLHCVGSRDEKVNQRHCSRVCCITGVKQAIELKKLFPKCDIYNFYMDIRMFGPGYEEMYRQAQEEFNIQFIRGRISEASSTMDKRVWLKAEDTLIGRPLQMTVDMLVLIVGMTSGASNHNFARTEGVELYPSSFIRPKNQFTGNVESGLENVFYAGTVTAPKNVGESINEGIAAAIKASEYLNKR